MISGYAAPVTDFQADGGNGVWGSCGIGILENADGKVARYRSFASAAAKRGKAA